MKNIFGVRLAKLRKERGYSQYKLADLMGFTRGQIANYEQGKRKPNLEILLKIADFFSCSIDYLLGRTDDLKQHEGDFDIEDFEYKSKTLAAALEEISELHFKYNFDEEMMTKLVIISKGYQILSRRPAGQQPQGFVNFCLSYSIKLFHGFVKFL